MANTGRITGSHLIGRSLKLEGVRNIFTLVGDHVLPAMDVLSDMDFNFVDVRHEQAAVHMADAWGRITGQPGISMYTTPGLANAIPGLAHAFHSESPVLSISGSANLSELGRGAMQEIEQVAMAAPVTKGSWMVTDARRIPDFIARALRTAYSGRRGPVHLTIPMDVQQQVVSEEDVRFYPSEQYRGGRTLPASPELVEEAIHLLSHAQRPLVIASGPAAYGDSGEVLQKFIETAQLPLLTEEQARGLVSDEHPNCFGFFERSLNPVAGLVKEADLVVLLGKKQDYTLGFALPPAIPADAKIIMVDPSASEIGRNRGVAVGIVADIGTTLEQLAQEASKRQWQRLPWLDRLKSEKDTQARRLDALATAETPIHAAYVHKTIGRFLKPDDFLVIDGGDYCHFGRAMLPARRPRRWLHLPTVGMLGSSLPTAMAAKLAHPEAGVVHVIGDGAFGFHAMEIDTALRHNLPFVTVLGNDSGWGIDRHIQMGLFGRTVRADLLPTRYDKVVEGLGGHGEYVQRPEELGPALDRAFAAGKPALVNVAVQGAISPMAEALIALRRPLAD